MKKAFLFLCCFLCGSVFAQDLYLRVASDQTYLFCPVYSDGNSKFIQSSPKKDGGFVRIPSHIGSHDLKSICIYGKCENVNDDQYWHYRQEDVIPIYESPKNNFSGMHRCVRQYALRCVMRLGSLELDSIRKFGNVCRLEFIISAVVASPTATFKIEKDFLPVWQCTNKNTGGPVGEEAVIEYTSDEKAWKTGYQADDEESGDEDELYGYY